MLVRKTFEDFLLSLERASPSQARLMYLQNQDLFIHRPDMLTSTVAQLPWSHGLSLLSAAYFVQKDLELDSYRVALSQILRHNKRCHQSPQTSCPWQVGLAVFSEALGAFGTQVPSPVYTSAAKLCLPQQRWDVALKVLKSAERHDRATNKLLLSVMESNIAAKQWCNALRLLPAVEPYMVRLAIDERSNNLLVEAGEADGNGVESSEKEAVRSELRQYGPPMRDRQLQAHHREVQRVAHVLERTLNCLPWKQGLALVSKSQKDSPLLRILSLSKTGFRRSHYQLLHLPWSMALQMAMQRPEQVQNMALPAQVAFFERIPNYAIMKNSMENMLSMRGANLPALKALLTTLAIREGSWESALECLQGLSAYFTLPAANQLSTVSSPVHYPSSSGLALGGEEMGSLLNQLTTHGRLTESLALLQLLVSGHFQLSRRAMELALRCVVLQAEMAKGRGAAGGIRWNQALAWYSSLHHEDQRSSVYAKKGGPDVDIEIAGKISETHTKGITLPPEALSLLLYFLVLDDAPKQALQLLAYVRTNGTELEHHHRLEPFLFCHQYQRWQEALGLFQQVLKDAEEGKLLDTEWAPLVMIGWSVLQRLGKPDMALNIVQTWFPAFGKK